MEKLKNKLFYLFIFAVIFAFGIVLVLIPSKDTQTTTYNINANIFENTLEAELSLDYVNNNNFKINELFFCLYPNALKNEGNIENTTVNDRVHEAYPDGFSEGYINVQEIYVNNKKVDFNLEESDQILRISIPELNKNKSVNVKIKFNDTLPYSPSRFGYGENTYNFGNWYPVLCPFVDGEPYKCLYSQIGDPFFSECANYNVTITLPPEFRIGTSGQILEKEIVDPMKTKWTIKGENIRDFAFIISDKYNVATRQMGETFVYSYYLNNDEIGKRTVDYAENALKIFNQLFGEYPYPALCIAESDFYIGGMEYPNVVFVNTDLYNESATEALEEVIVHEIAHQWWYGVVGNNEIEDAWLDEGLTQYSVALYYEKLYGPERYKSFLMEGEIYTKVIFDILNNANIDFTKNIERKTTDFENWLLYDALVYDVSALMFDDLRNKIGDESFFEGVKEYYETYKFKNVTKDDFINVLNKSCKKNIEGIIEPWLKGKIYWG